MTLIVTVRKPKRTLGIGHKADTIGRKRIAACPLNEADIEIPPSGNQLYSS